MRQTLLLAAIATLLAAAPRAAVLPGRLTVPPPVTGTRGKNPTQRRFPIPT